MVSYIEEGILAKDISKHDPEVNIWAQERRKCGMKSPQ